MGREATVDFLVPMTVRVDIDEGMVNGVWLHLDSFQDTLSAPLHYTDEKGKEHTVWMKDVFFGGDFAGHEFDRELGAGEHPLVERAFAIADRVRVDPSEFQPRYHVEEPVPEFRSEP